MEAPHDGVQDSAPARRVVEYDGMQRQFLSGEVFDGEMEGKWKSSVCLVLLWFTTVSWKLTLTGLGDVTCVRLIAVRCQHQSLLIATFFVETGIEDVRT
jgi:hypothetical protein